MAVSLFIGVSIFIAALTYITYKLLSEYLHKWFEMKSIPHVEGLYPFIGNALQFKTNAGGKKRIRYAEKKRAGCVILQQYKKMLFVVLCHLLHALLQQKSI